MGNLLIKKAVELAIKKKKNRVWLGVWEHNIPALKFYEKQGFSIFSKHIFHMGEDPQTDYLMEKYL